MDLGLKDSVAFITGASKGIGKAIAEVLAEEGCKVVITARGEALLRQVAEDISARTGVEVLAVAGDMMVTAEVERAVQAAYDRFERIDVLVPCAGAATPGVFETITEEQWLSSLNLKFMGYVRALKVVLPRMRERGHGSVVMVVGNDGLKNPYYEVAPGAANAADINLASALAEQYGRYGIRINTVNPGPVDTERWAWGEATLARNKSIDVEQARKLVLASLPLNRICKPQEIANVVAFLASPRASYVSGANIPVDGAQRKALMDADLVLRDLELSATGTS